MFPKNPYVDGEFQRALTNRGGRIRMGFCEGCGVVGGLPVVVVVFEEEDAGQDGAADGVPGAGDGAGED